MAEKLPCFCSGCVPNNFREVCAACGEEIRFGERHGHKAFWHREDVDHVPIHGHRAQPPDSNVLEAPEPTEEEIAAEALRNAKVEVWAHDVPLTDFAPQSGIRQIGNLVTGETRLMPNGKTSKSKKHPPAAPGWELINLHHARGPYKGSKGEVLSVSDTHVMRARGPVGLDGARRWAVASWRDLKFDFAWIGIIKDGRLTIDRRATSDEMKDWIRGHDLPEPVREPGE